MSPVALSGCPCAGVGAPGESPKERAVIWLGIIGIAGLIFWGTLQKPKRRGHA